MKKLLAICSIMFTVCVTFTGCGEDDGSSASENMILPETRTEVTTEMTSTEKITEKTTQKTTRPKATDDGRDTTAGDHINDAVDGIEDAGEDIIDGAGDAVNDVVDGLDGSLEDDAVSEAND